MIARPIRAIFSKSAFRKGSSKAKTSESIANTSCDATARSSLDDGSEHSMPTFSVAVPTKSTKSVSFQMDRCNYVVETIHEYPSIDEQAKEMLYWAPEEVTARKQARDAVFAGDDSDNKSRFVACVEELFQVPISKRQVSMSQIQSSSSDSDRFNVMTLQQDAMDGIMTSEYRGYEQRCSKTILASRRRAIRQVMASYWIRGDEEIAQVSCKWSARQVAFARLVAEADAKFAAAYLSQP